MNTSIPIFKIVVLGEGRVGKTSMTLKFTKDQFNEDQQSSINACYLQKVIQVTDQNQKVKLAIWDTAGQEKYNAVAPVYYRDAVGAIIVYDITSTQSFEKVKKWVEELRNHANKKNIKIVIVGNKSDLQSQRRVKQKQAQNYANIHKTKHYTVSAKNGANIAELFSQLGGQIFLMNKKGDEVMIGGKRIPRLMVDDPKQTDEKKKKKKDCCQN